MGLVACSCNDDSDDSEVQCDRSVVSHIILAKYYQGDAGWFCIGWAPVENGTPNRLIFLG